MGRLWPTHCHFAYRHSAENISTCAIRDARNPSRQISFPGVISRLLGTLGLDAQAPGLVVEQGAEQGLGVAHAPCLGNGLGQGLIITARGEALAAVYFLEQELADKVGQLQVALPG
jgi:hypothetical protein